MESNFMKDVVEKKREAKTGEMITMSKKVYQARLGKTYNRGRVHALKDLDYTIPEIAETLGLQESTVRSIVNDGM